METEAAVALLRDAAGERVDGRTTRRLADVASLLVTDMAWVERELAASAREGLSPSTESAVHLLEAGGKRVRPMAVLLSAACFGPISASARELAVVAELVHLATLLHDDVVDDSDDRRGKPAARRLWGNAVSVLAGDLLLTHALERTSKVSPPAVLSELFATLRQLVDGEVVQLRGRTCLDVTEATYFRILRDKTASLFVWATRAGARTAGAAPAAVSTLGEFGGHLGIAFQLIDDALDYAGDRQATGKTLYADVLEGKLTLPLILAIARRPSLAGDLDRVRGGDEAAAGAIVAAVHEANTCDEVAALARKHTADALQALSLVPACPARDLLGCVAEDLASRLA